MASKREVKAALSEKPVSRIKISGTPKRALPDKPAVVKTSQVKRTVKRALAK